MSRTLRRGGWCDPKYQHMNWFDLPEEYWRRRWNHHWQYLKVHDEGDTHGPRHPTVKQGWRQYDRALWNREAKKEEPQLPRNHRHWGIWDWW